jgi:uncharacterized protein (DUF1697 family)
MTAFVALLRGINVGKHRRVAMADVRAAAIDAGYDDVTSYLQSGNLIFESRGHTSAAVGAALEKVFEKSLQLDIDVIVRSASELAKVVAKNPLFDAKLDPKLLHVAFLKQKPTAAAARTVQDVAFGRDEFVLQGTELYFRYPTGSGQSKMSAAFFEKKLGTPATARNWRVVTALAELAADR